MNKTLNLKRVVAIGLAASATWLCSTGSAFAYDARVRIVNNSSFDVTEIHVSPTYRDIYGHQDLLGSTILDSGYNMIVNFDVDDAENRCLLDVEAMGSNGGRWQRRMDVCSATVWNLY